MATRSNKNLSQFKSRLIGGGARPNLFEVELTTFPDAIAEGWDADTFQFMCKSAALPASNIAQIDVPFRGRIFKVAGDRTVDTWTVTVINDENFGLRYAFEAWVEHMARLANNIGATLPAAYMSNATVYQLGRGKELSSQDNSGSNNVVLAQYNFIDIFPTNVSQIDLSYDNGDQIEEFTVEFQVNSWNRGELSEPDEE
jgi:hypothetical protein|tara:strand:- start:195 stop:791 length:597 start_codon:yes stop_codon:yes gene_type:complete